VIWGDICHPKERTIFVSLSLAIILMNRLLMVIIPPFVELQQLFSFISFFLFLSAFIIMLLPETLPESIRREKELLLYIKRAKKIKEKYG
ncbi:MAG: hypothetical protein N3D72_01615, partial [Candidatus Methanomethyliaceae archaeon]|nr:hypothetical protein [Candidatus Methanomethyliaceae archaeon]